MVWPDLCFIYHAVDSLIARAIFEKKQTTTIDFPRYQLSSFILIRFKCCQIWHKILKIHIFNKVSDFIQRTRICRYSWNCLIDCTQKSTFLLLPLVTQVTLHFYGYLVIYSHIWEFRISNAIPNLYELGWQIFRFLSDFKSYLIS